jgi:hypothetical protein
VPGNVPASLGVDGFTGHSNSGGATTIVPPPKLFGRAFRDGNPCCLPPTLEALEPHTTVREAANIVVRATELRDAFEPVPPRRGAGTIVNCVHRVLYSLQFAFHFT